MERRIPQSKSFGFTREIKSTSASKVHPSTDENEEDAVSILSVDETSPTNIVR